VLPAAAFPAYCRRVESLIFGIVLGVAGLALGHAGWVWLRGRTGHGTPWQRTTYDVLHTASSAARGLRAGLTQESAQKALPSLRIMLAARATAILDDSGLLAWEGPGLDHAPLIIATSGQVLASGKARSLGRRDLACAEGIDCPLRSGVVVPLTRGSAVVGTLVALGPAVHPGLSRTAGEVARFASTQLELADLDSSRARAAEAELRFLRAQISPHFVYNSLTAVASFMRSDPDRARVLLLGFADFIRYSFRSRSQFATIAEELQAVDSYLELERARFGERLQVILRVAPSVLNVSVPCLLLQPLVENAVRHGLEHKEGVGHVTIVAREDGAECVLSVEDDGVGMDPDVALAGRRDDGVGLANVDERLRQVFGAKHRLVIETALGEGTKVTVRVPTKHVTAGVKAS
jgi:two-component system, LytTR family, sensor kinase